MKSKKVISFITASAMSVCSVSASISSFIGNVNAADSDIILQEECENLTLGDCTVWQDIYGDKIPDYSGEGFIYLTNASFKTEVTVEADGMYEIIVRYAQILDQTSRMQTVSVNGLDSTIDFPYTHEWKDISMGHFRLNKGVNTIEFKPMYGYACYDTITIKKTPKHDYSKAVDTLVDPKATPEAKSLMKYLKSVYGSNVISGQQEIYGGGNDGNSELEFDYIKETTGKLPAIRAFDLMNYNPLYGWEDGTTERAVDWVKNKNGIISSSWHLNVPIDFENYEVGDAVDWQKCSYKNYQESNTTFNTANILKEGTKEREFYEEAMKDLAEQIKIMQDNNVPIIFRPLHEAQGNYGLYGGTGTAWFWWGDHGPEVYKELWKLLFTTLTEKYDLHNIIWEYNSYAYPNSAEWYPGDEYVDIVAFDKYNCQYNRGDGKTSGPNFNAIASTFTSLYELTNGKKLVSMAENDTIPSVDNLKTEDAGWLYFCPWYGEYLMSDTYQDADNLKEIYNSDYCITLEELPADLYKNGGTVIPTEPKTNASTEASAKLNYGDANCDSKVDISDVVLLKSWLLNSSKYSVSKEGLANSDVQEVGNGVNNNDIVAIQQYSLKLVDKLPV